MTKSVSDARIVAATFRTVSDADAFDDMIAAWGERFKLHLRDGELGDLDTELGEHIREAMAQFRKQEATPDSDPIDDAIAIAAPALVLSAEGLIVALNEAAAQAFNAVQGRSIDTDWLDPRSIADFETLLQSAKRRTNRMQAILRLVGSDDRVKLAEAVVMRTSEASSDLLFIRVIDAEWSTGMDQVLGEAFGLTDAEIGIARAMFELRDSGAIAEQRGTSIHTVRTQLRTIQAKTEVASQTDLVRLLTLLAHTRLDTGSSAPAKWRDPWPNQGLLDGPDGLRVAYSWTGDPDGKDVLILHNIVHGYAFPVQVEKRLAEAGIRLVAIQRPGFGRSTAPRYDEKTHLDALQTVIEGLELKDVVGVQLSGTLGIVRSALRDPHLYKSILLPGMAPPYTKEVKALFPKQSLAVVVACRKSPMLGRLFIETALRSARRKGMDWLAPRMFVTGEADQACLQDSAMRPYIRNAFELTIGADPAALRWIYGSHLDDYDFEIEALTVPVHALVGTNFAYYHKQSMDDFASRSDLFTWDQVPGAGLKMLYQRPDLIADHIIRAANA
ncbi:hypothetical protein BPTFM16_00791 [Altererythrobacter insulae]|nr:hypothetical protein BPTFM16_00791 [Altererythrobacter insulae]